MMRGVAWLAQRSARVFKGLFGFFSRFKRFLPKSILGFFILIKFFSNLFTHGYEMAFQELAKSIFSAELVIRENTMLAIQNSPNYGIMEFVEIVFSFMILWYLIKMLGTAMIRSGMVGEWMAYFWAFIIMFVIETSAVILIRKEVSFIPIYDGVYFFFQNIGVVLSNIQFF